MDFCRKQVKTDCEELLSRFQKTDSVRFEIFSKIWREMKFSEIFYGTTKSEERLFSRLILDMASSFFLPPFSFQVRVGGLYLLYSLYHCQTTSPSEQIRLALKDWEDVQKFERDAVDAQHFDVVYILRKLMCCQAFQFTAMPRLLTYNKKRKAEVSEVREDFVERPSRPQELVNVELLEELSNIHELYEKMKTTVCAATPGADQSVNLIRKNLVPELRGTVMDFYTWQKRKEPVGEAEDLGEGTSSQQECSQRAGLLASIKSKAYGQAAESSKSRRHRQVEVDFTSYESGANNEPRPSRTTRPSLKSRTNESVYISGDLQKEATASTNIHRLVTLDSGREEKPKVHKRFKW